MLKIPIDRLNDDTRLEELGAESIDIIEIVFALEEKFDIDISLRMNQDAQVQLVWVIYQTDSNELQAPDQLNSRSRETKGDGHHLGGQG